jgi:hypothetical protein
MNLQVNLCGNRFAELLPASLACTLAAHEGGRFGLQLSVPGRLELANPKVVQAVPAQTAKEDEDFDTM